MNSKYLVSGLAGFKIGIPLKSVLGTEIAESRDIDYSGYKNTVRFRGSEILLINLIKKKEEKKSGNILVALQHPYCTIGILFDTLYGIYEIENVFPLPDIIKKASKGILEHYVRIDGMWVFTINVDALLTLEEFKQFEDGMLV